MSQTRLDKHLHLGQLVGTGGGGGGGGGSRD